MTRMTVECDIHIRRGRKGRCGLGSGAALPVPESGRVPRLARLMALAIRFEDLIRTGQVADYADVARLGHVSRARITQIMNLLLLAPDIQEQVLFLPHIRQGRDPIHLQEIQAIALEWDWGKQRRRWASFLRDRFPPEKDSGKIARNCLEVDYPPR